MTVLFCDLETFCETPINHGTHKYAEGVEVMLFAWAVGDEAEQVWDLTADEPMPERLKDLLDDPEVMTVWQNGGNFDRTMLRHGLKIELPIERVHDTMVRALAHGLPGSLDKLCGVMGIASDAAKDKAGKSLIQLFCKPRPKNMKIRRANRFTHPVEWERFKEYAKSDIRAMRVLYSKLPTWNYNDKRTNYAVNEKDLWYLDQKINDRGVRFDVELAEAAVRAVDIAQAGLARRTQELTNGEVERASKRDQMLRHILAEYGIDLPDMKADTLERRIEDPDLPEELKELLRIRLQATTTSTTKYRSGLRGVSRDGRLRGLLQFDGASRTRRWAGRLWQPQNLPRPNLKAAEIEQGIEAIKAGCADLITDNVMELTSNAIRGCIIPSEGKKLVVTDLSNIEGRVAAWLAGENWKLRAFRDYDTILGEDAKGKPIRKGQDNYVLAYAKAFGVHPDSVDQEQRQIGKVMELMLQYQGGVGAFLTGAMTYGFDIEDMAAKAIGGLSPTARKAAEGMLAWRKKKRLTTYGLSDQGFIVCEAFKALWREAHPEISSYWEEIEKGAIRAIENPGLEVPVRKITFVKSGAWLRAILPSTNSMCYPSAKVEDGKITYWGVHQYTRKWSKLHTYGGKFFEQFSQSLARDTMAHNMPEAEAKGYELLLTAHDELITEAPDTDAYTARELSGILATNAPWNEGLPLAAAGFEADRYRKG